MALEIFGHNLMHIVIVIVAAILFVLSLITYLRTRKTKFLFICAAFLVFAVKEVILAVNIITFGTDPLMIFTHFLDLVILLLFAFGILK